MPEVRFAGRAAEWAVLDRAWASAQAGSRVVVLVGGEAGAGKTRLAAEFALLRFGHRIG